MRRLPKILKRARRPSNLFRVETLELEFSNGARRTYERLISPAVGAVIIVPLIEPETALLLREYAAGLHRYELGLPKGRLEPDETPEQGANRELKEEAGYGARRLEVINTLSLAPTYMSHLTHIVLARELYPCRLEGDEPEPMETVRWPLARLNELAQRDDVSEGRSIAALYLARDHLERE